MCYCVMSLLWWSEVVWISDGAPVLSFQQSWASPCILSAPFPGVHGENKSDWLWTVLKAHECTHFSFMPLLLRRWELCVSAFHRCFPLSSLKGFPALWVELLVLFRCPSATLVGVFHAWCRCWDFFSPNLLPEDFNYGTVNPLSLNH